MTCVIFSLKTPWVETEVSVFRKSSTKLQKNLSQTLLILVQRGLRKQKRKAEQAEQLLLLVRLGDRKHGRFPCYCLVLGCLFTQDTIIFKHAWESHF